MKTKLLFINQTLDLGGAEVFHTDLLVALQKIDFTVSAFVTEPRYMKMLNEQGVQTDRIPVVIDLVGNWKGLLKAVFFFPRAFNYYQKIVRQHQYANLVLLSSFTEKIFVSPIAAKYKIPVAWIEFGPIHPLLKKFYGLPGFLYNRVSSIPEIVIVPSKNTARELIAHQNIAKEKIIIIPCGRNITETAVSSLQKAEVLPESIICVSRLEAGKGQDLLLSAFSLVKKEYPNANLYITGQSSWISELKNLAKKLGIADSVNFLGRVPNSLAWMAKCQVCVFPSVWELEGFGLVMIEAMALGKPIVAFNVGPAPEIIQNDVNGLLADKGNIRDLAKQLILALKNTPHTKQIAAQAEKDFVAHYQITEIAATYKKHFMNIMTQLKSI